MAGEPDAAHNVDLEEPHPVGVGDLLEGLRLEDPDVVDQDVHVGDLANQILHAVGGGQVGIHARDLAAASQAPDLLHGLLDPLPVRPLTTTEAPSRYSPAAAANPIPAVEPVTNARLPRSCRSMSSPRVLVDRGGSRYDTSDRSRT